MSCLLSSSNPVLGKTLTAFPPVTVLTDKTATRRCWSLLTGAFSLTRPTAQVTILFCWPQAAGQPHCCSGSWSKAAEEMWHFQAHPRENTPIATTSTWERDIPPKTAHTQSTQQQKATTPGHTALHFQRCIIQIYLTRFMRWVNTESSDWFGLWTPWV